MGSLPTTTLIKLKLRNKMMGPLGGMMNQMTGGNQLEPGVPEATKYALFFAVLTGIGGVVCMVMSPKMGAGNSSQRPNPRFYG